MEIVIELLPIILSSTAIGTLLAAFIRRWEAKLATNDFTQELLLGLTQTVIIREVSRHKELGYIEPHELAIITNSLYSPYVNMGGNGYAVTAINELKELPTHNEWLKSNEE